MRRFSRFCAIPAAPALGILLALLAAGTALSQSVVLRPPLAVGEGINLEMTATREKSVAGQPASKTVAVTQVRVEVLEVADKQTVIGWTTGRAKLENAPLDKRMANEIEPLLDLFADQTVELVFDAEFTPRSIRNLDAMIQLSEKIIGRLQHTLRDHELAAQTIPRLREIFGKPDVLQSMIIQKPARYFLAYGWELEPGKQREVEMSIPSPLGGEPLPAVLSIELKPFQPTDNHYLVLYRQTPDHAGVQRYLRDYLRKISGDTTTPDQPLPKLDFGDSAEFKINRKTGWVEHATVRRTITSDDVTQIETVTFRLEK
jgi:hypothetical protein